MSLRKFISNYWYYSLIFIISLSIAWPLFLPGYFSHHDDLQVMRIFEMRKCIEDLQIPCRWVPDMGFGNGYPLFNYYNVFPYYIGALSSYILGFIGSAKLLFFISVVLAPLSMFILVRKVLGPVPAILSAVFYAFAPYRALDIYVRGAVAESFALAIIPVFFYFGFKLKESNSLKNKLGLAATFAAFLTSHNIMTLIFLPVILLIFIVFYWGEKVAVIRSVILFLILGFGLAAFFLLPAFFEKDLVQIDNLARLDLDFRAHFVTLYQLFFDRGWGYGASFLGTGDTISFQIGWPHWWGVLLSFLILPFLKKRKLVLIYFILLVSFIFAIFMAHTRSAFIWEIIGVLRFAQFPWRFLSVAIFSASFIGGFLIYPLKKQLQIIVVIFLIIPIILLNWSYFKPQTFYLDLTDGEKLSGVLWETQQKASILDYLPNGAVEPREQALKPIITGEGEIEYFEKKSNYFKIKANIKTSSEIIVPVFDFPKWQISDKNKIIEHKKDSIGRISFKLEPGEYIIYGKLANTLIRTVGNLTTALSVLFVCYLIFYKKNLKI